MKKLRTAAKWIWNHRGQEIWWLPSVLTDNPDPTSPKLSSVEAESVFRLLEDEKLIFPLKHPTEMKTVYLINEVRKAEWELFLKKTNPFYLYVTRLELKCVWKFLIWLLGTVIVAYVTILVQKRIG